MTKPVLAESRQGGLATGRTPSVLGSGVDMPVLFQLTDQSPLKILSPPARPKPETKSPPAASSPAAAESEAPSVAESKAAVVHAAESISEGKGTNAAAVTADARSLKEPANPTGGNQPLLTSAADAAKTSTTPIPDSPTIRERAQIRQHRQAAAHGDWFQTQGKYIIVVFLIALGGIIYLARRGDDSPTSPMSDPHTHGLVSDTPSLPTESDPTAVRASDESPLLREGDAHLPADPNPAVASAEPSTNARIESNPAAIAGNPTDVGYSPLADHGQVTEQPQVDLHAPLANQEQAPIEHSQDQSLFPWAAVNQEPRVASRPQPDTAPSSVPMPRSNPHYQQRPAGTTAPAGPSYQGAGSQSPDDSPPEADAVPAVYPVTDPATYRSFPSQPQRSVAPVGAAPAGYDSRTPPAPRTSGPRYERTGSGLY